MGALLDHGVKSECISLVVNDKAAGGLGKAAHGVTTTTAGDADSR